ncbi:MAG: single-stranded-DNA-specific exonuclease RecJ [Chitinophagales bacterium]
MQAYRWEVKEVDQEAVSALHQSLKINPILCKLLVQRGVKTYDEAHHFFRPKLSHLHDPFLMQDMNAAIERIERAIQQKEKVLVYGDYDVDGTTSVALVYTFFNDFIEDLGHYQPDRYKEGYGISMASIDFAKANDYSLIIALDCGIKAVEKVNYAKANGIDYIICDHHLPGEAIPDAVAVLDPKRKDCNYPYKELSGCGIGFKLIQAFAAKHSVDESKVYDLLDLLAISISADIVPITGENRVLTYFGLQLINKAPRPGIKALLETAQCDKVLNITDLVFVIAPRINAAGRIKHANYAVELLLEENAEQALVKAKEINEQNSTRKDLDKDITENALAMLQEDVNFIGKKSTVVYQEDWHKGVIGIVASRLIEHYYKPTVVLTRSNGKVVGSARSVKGFNLYTALEACQDQLIQFGGHKYAAGMTMEEAQIPGFIEKFEEVVSATIQEESLVPVIEIDAEIEFGSIDEKFFNIVEQFAPFGPGNMRPIFMTKDVRDSGNSRIVKEDHLKVEVFKSGQRNMKGIAFGMAAKLDYIQRKTQFDICYQLQMNEWKDYRNVEMMVKDIR